MPKRISFVLSDDVLKKLRDIQAKMIKTESRSVSFYRVVNDLLKKGLN